MSAPSAPPAFAVFASGAGSNLQRFIAETQAGAFPATLALVVSDRPGCPALERARAAGIATCAFAPTDYAAKSDYERAILAELRARAVRWIVLAGYMRLIGPTLLEPYRDGIVNVHPSLLPAFPGRDAIGQALRAGVPETGVTVHLVDEGIDTGPVLAQEAVPILPGDSADTLAARIHAVEHRLYPAVVRGWMGRGRQ
ncbi:MAG TPA: phosphoribosylglycinamide formyltransferase [Ktedonobacterales bacterium]|nr:phosphoribosylglycinamide formyltransferase [Ktedonobacterales bacterium]